MCCPPYIVFGVDVAELVLRFPLSDRVGMTTIIAKDQPPERPFDYPDKAPEAVAAAVEAGIAHS